MYQKAKSNVYGTRFSNNNRLYPNDIQTEGDLVMKKAPYGEYFEFNDEVKEYKKLCKNKSNKYLYYLDWKKDTKEKISKFPKENDNAALINFQHYVINSKRVSESIRSSVVSVLIFCLTFMFSKLLPDKYDVIGIFIGLFAFTFFILLEKLDNDYEYCFYSDLLEAIDEVLAERKQQTMSNEEKENG